tara:strand:+ start:2088 stop:2549 length:462 start_codon:yes stop_codon:yes gene_type:complete
MLSIKKTKIDTEAETNNNFFESPYLINNYYNMKRPDFFLLKYLDKLYKKNSNYDIWYTIYNLTILFREHENFQKDSKNFLGTFWVIAHKYWEDDYLFLYEYELDVCVNRNKIRKIEVYILEKIFRNEENFFFIPHTKGKINSNIFLEQIKSML